MTPTDTTTETDRCPACGSKGRTVPARTVQSLATAEALRRAGEGDGFRFCAGPGCEIAYFRAAPAERILQDEVVVRIGQKEAAAPRPVCYCFGHTVEEIEQEVARTGDSAVADQVTERCRQGLARCEEANPQGVCCLGNVRAAIRTAQARRTGSAADAPQVDGATGCCAATGAAPGPAAAQAAPPRAARAGAWASAGAVVSAVFSSACCWLPLLLVAFGASAAGVAGFFEAQRPCGGVLRKAARATRGAPGGHRRGLRSGPPGRLSRLTEGAGAAPAGARAAARRRRGPGGAGGRGASARGRG